MQNAISGFSKTDCSVQIRGIHRCWLSESSAGSWTSNLGGTSITRWRSLCPNYTGRPINPRKLLYHEEIHNESSKSSIVSPKVNSSHHTNNQHKTRYSIPCYWFSTQEKDCGGRWETKVFLHLEPVGPRWRGKKQKESFNWKRPQPLGIKNVLLSLAVLVKQLSLGSPQRSLNKCFLHRKKNPGSSQVKAKMMSPCINRWWGFRRTGCGLSSVR